jgi:hypothetical protein
MKMVATCSSESNGIHGVISQKTELFPFLLRLFFLFKVVFYLGEKRNAYRILVGMPEEKRPLGRPRRRWVDNTKWILER